MPKISFRVNQKELNAIREYANHCGETVPDLIRKSVIRDATLADGYGADDPQYEFGRQASSKLSAQHEHDVTEQNYNKIRRALGWKEIKL